MFYRPDISACDQCGHCCSSSPCLLASPADVERLAAGLGKSTIETLTQDLQVERTPKGRWQVRVRPTPSGACHLLIDNRCGVHEHKPTGGREYKCWDRRTFAASYEWSKHDLDQLVGTA